MNRKGSGSKPNSARGTEENHGEPQSGLASVQAEIRNRIQAQSGVATPPVCTVSHIEAVWALAGLHEAAAVPGASSPTHIFRSPIFSEKNIVVKFGLHA
jgi:hypothetical protein